MRESIRTAVPGILAALLVASAPSAARAAAIPFTGSLSVTIGIFPTVSVPGSGVATVGGPGAHAATLSVPAGVFATVGQVAPITDPASFPVMGLLLTAQNGAGAFGGAPLGGVMPLSGVAKMCLFNGCPYEPVQNISIPLSVAGVGGSKVLTGLVNITVQGNPWTTGVAMVGSAQATGFAHGPASGTSSTAAPSGTIRLVTPILISTNNGGGTLVPTFATLDLHFVPEPGTLLLLGSGVVLFAAAGRRLETKS